MVSSGVYPFLDHLARWAFLPVFIFIKEVRNGNWCREVVQCRKGLWFYYA